MSSLVVICYYKYPGYMGQDVPPYRWSVIGTCTCGERYADIVDRHRGRFEDAIYVLREFEDDVLSQPEGGTYIDCFLQGDIMPIIDAFDELLAVWEEIRVGNCRRYYHTW